MTLDTVITLLDDLYRHHRYPHEADPALGTRIRALVQQLCDRVAAVAGTTPEIRGPANMDSYHLVSWPLQQGLPAHPINVDVFSLAAPARYLMARVCHFAPLVELSWLELGYDDDLPYRRSSELLDPSMLNTDPRAETIALTALQAVEELGLEMLPWEFLRLPARSDWPREFWMPEPPEMRNYLFPGFFETWPEAD